VARQISFADFELMRQGIRLEPLLQAIADFLDDQKEMIERVRRDLVRGLKRPRSGRRGLTPQQTLRALVLMRVKNWDYRELRERIADGLMLRQFADFYCDPVPKHDAFNRGFNRLTPETLKVVNDLVVQAAVDLGLEDGTKLRVDTTVVQTDIHHPTDNTLLWDVVRVVTRLVRRLGKALELRRIKGFRDRTPFGTASNVRDPADDDEATRRGARPGHIASSSALPRRLWKEHEWCSRRPARRAARICLPTWPSKKSARTSITIVVWEAM